MSQSKKHHYIPRFYLKGFTNDLGQFYIYDKKKNEIRKSKPENSFFEKYRNTGDLNGEKSDIPEQMLAHFDSESAEVLYKINNSKINENVLTPENLFRIRFFIASTFWRIPKNDKRREDIIKNYTFKELGFGYFNKDTGKRNIEIEDIFKDLDLFRKLYSSILPLVSFMERYKTQNYNEWRLVHRTNSIHITGDYPIILKNQYNDFTSIQKDLIMPLSSKKIILCTDKKVPDSFPPEFNVKMDIIILHQSERFVCSSNKEYLRFIIEKLYKISTGKKWENKMIEDIFNYFK